MPEEGMGMKEKIRQTKFGVAMRMDETKRSFGWLRNLAGVIFYLRIEP
jgi:hypothetical protein